MADEHPGGLPPQPPAEDAPPLPPAEANGAAKDAKDRRSSRDRSRSRKRSRSRDRRRSRSRDRRRRSRSRDRSRDRRDRERRRSDRDRDSERPRRPSSPDRRRYERPRSRERFRRREPTPPEVREERQRQAELEALDRDTRTVFAYNLPLRAEEKEIFQFFIKAGPLNDIKVITDKTTGRSKGFAYVEFQRKEDVINALALTGQVLMGQAVMVKMSEAEKNLAWEAAEQVKRQQKELEERLGPNAVAAMVPLVPPPMPPGVPGVAGVVPGMAPIVPAGPARLALSGLPPQISEADLRPILEPFGLLDFVLLQRDAAGAATGGAFVQYRLLADATKAKENLAGLDIVGHKLEIAWAAIEAPAQPAPPLPAVPQLAAALAMAPAVDQLPDRLDEPADGTGGGGIKLTGQSRAALMSKLAANAGLDVSNVPQIPLPAAPAPQQVPAGLALEQGLLGPASPIATQCLLLKNMFDPAEETADGWDAEIAEDVGGECTKYGPVEHVFVDRNSRGFVYVKFASVASAQNAQRALHGRWFAQRQIAADFQFAPVYNQHFGL